MQPSNLNACVYWICMTLATLNCINRTRKGKESCVHPSILELFRASAVLLRAWRNTWLIFAATASELRDSDRMSAWTLVKILLSKTQKRTQCCANSNSCILLNEITFSSSFLFMCGALLGISAKYSPRIYDISQFNYYSARLWILNK